MSAPSELSALLAGLCPEIVPGEWEWVEDAPDDLNVASVTTTCWSRRTASSTPWAS